ncbi:MAG: RHS repeat protein, partial [candidate division NC10 bacterium]|nr:RHS repeat protein [candidate division NC10 bacterium]
MSSLASYLRVLGALLILAVGASGVSAQEIRYLYDDLGRLVGVVDPQGNAAEYVYDAVGNILQIKRFNVVPGAAVAITLVTPN